MTRNVDIVIRPFDGSLSDARGVSAVERVTFDESPYDAEAVRIMLSQGPQNAWLAVQGQNVVGFVIAFRTLGLHGLGWEIDLLAILPDWRGRRLATRLIQAAAARGTEHAAVARAFVADDNTASARAFGRAGFRQEPEMCMLLVHRAEQPAPQYKSATDVAIQEAALDAQAIDWLGRFRVQDPESWSSISSLKGHDELLASATTPVSEPHAGATLLFAERHGQAVGYAELLHVETLLYRGIWIESLVATDRVVCEALVQEAVRRTRNARLDELGVMALEGNWRLQRTLLAGGFRSLGWYRKLMADLPLPAQQLSPPARTQEHGEAVNG